ncbi:MAG: PAS domain S-box protein [Gammaproteobacteria bacterium]
MKGFVGTLIDVSERERTLAALRESETRFELFMESNPAIAWIKDGNGRYLYMNRAWEREFGIDRETRIGKTARDLTATPTITCRLRPTSAASNRPNSSSPISPITMPSPACTTGCSSSRGSSMPSIIRHPVQAALMR